MFHRQCPIRPASIANEVIPMTLRIATLSTALLFGLTLALGAGSAVAGDGKSCGDKKKGESAAVVMPAQPLA
jgi:hypothetical protein